MRIVSSNPKILGARGAQPWRWLVGRGVTASQGVALQTWRQDARGGTRMEESRRTGVVDV